MSDIQRWLWTPTDMRESTSIGIGYVKYEVHLADKTAALEAQAEEHARDLLANRMQLGNAHAGERSRLAAKHAAALEAQAEEHAADILQEQQAHHDSVFLLNKEHAVELAARDEHLEVALSQQIIWQRRYDAVNAEIEALRGEGEPALIQFKHYRKKPIEVEAIRFDGHNGFNIERWSGRAVIGSPVLEPTEDNPTGSYLQIKTLEGVMTAIVGDWIIKGAVGEFYPCKPDAFEATFEVEPVDA